MSGLLILISRIVIFSSLPDRHIYHQKSLLSRYSVTSQIFAKACYYKRRKASKMVINVTHSSSRLLSGGKLNTFYNVFYPAVKYI